jgi:hypothetical protein
LKLSLVSSTVAIENPFSVDTLWGIRTPSAHGSFPALA